MKKIKILMVVLVCLGTVTSLVNYLKNDYKKANWFGLMVIIALLTFKM